MDTNINSNCLFYIVNSNITSSLSMKKQLELIIQPKVIDHLGIKMYQKPVDVIAEFIANAWDADSESVDIMINENSITISDKGLGMTYEQCQSFFLTVGRDRRFETGKEISDEKKRPILGRKGIGKFAGFGIAKIVEIKTISEADGELTSFQMNIDEILKFDASGKAKKPITVYEYKEPSSKRKKEHGTIVSLLGVDNKAIDLILFKEELARRFLLTQSYNDFKITVNSEKLPECFNDELEYIFPRNLTMEERNKIPNLESVDANGWAIETFEGHKIAWRVGFFEDPIETEELRGISIFVKGKLAQKPFFFDITGGISGQHGLEYMTGQIKMDFIDEGAIDLIATERQRINLQTPLGRKIREWGIEKIKLLSSFWKKKRSDQRLKEIEDKLGGFKDRLDALPSSERQTVKSVLRKIASFERLGKQRFQDWCNAILTSWETGRLKDLITELSQAKDLDEYKFLELLSEADVLTALNIAESIKTKIYAISELKNRVASGQLENKVRDYIYERPWLIHPKWERFQKERSVEKLIKDLGITHLDSEVFNGRVDLALSSGDQLLLVEFIRPGIEIDLDHLKRIDLYVTDIRNRISKETANPIRHLNNAYVIADNKKDTELIHSIISDLEKKGILIMKWETLIEQALKQWSEYLDLLKKRNPKDKRIQGL